MGFAKTGKFLQMAIKRRRMDGVIVDKWRLEFVKEPKGREESSKNLGKE